MSRFNSSSVKIVDQPQLFENTDITAGYSINTTTGEPTVSASNNLSGFIPVEAEEPYTLYGISRIGYYTVDNTFISTIAPGVARKTIVTPATTRFIRVVVANGYLSTAQVNPGLILYSLDYPYLEVAGYRVNTLDDAGAVDKFVIDGTLEGVYSSAAVTDVLDMDTWQASQIYTLYDALVTAYPNYVTKVTLGNDSAGNTIYGYNFKYTSVPAIEYPVKEPKMVLISGIHGDEKAAVYGLYQTMKQICEGWASNALLETLRWNCHFITIPIVNVSGYNANTRYTANSVNIARNFLVNWASGDGDHPGTAPLSEKETQYVDKVILENRDAVLFVSIHHFTITAGNNNYFINPYNGSTLMDNVSKNVIKKLTRKWKAAYAWLPQDDITYFGLSNTFPPNGSETQHAAFYGIQSCTYEICKEFLLETGHAPYNELALTLGAESIVNFLIMGLQNCCDYYNRIY